MDQCSLHDYIFIVVIKFVLVGNFVSAPWWTHIYNYNNIIYNIFIWHYTLVYPIKLFRYNCVLFPPKKYIMVEVLCPVEKETRFRVIHTCSVAIRQRSLVITLIRITIQDVCVCVSRAKSLKSCSLVFIIRPWPWPWDILPVGQFTKHKDPK